MIKKIFVGVLLAGLFILLIFGAVNRTLAKTADRNLEISNRSLSEGYGSSGNADFGNPDHLNGTGNGIGQAGQPEGAPSDGSGIGLAEVDQWLTETATVATVNADEWIVTLSDGTIIEIEGRLLSYVNELGFSVNPGDNLVLTGFLENGDFEIGQIENLSTGEKAVARDVNGRPLWAGGRQGGR